MSGGRNSRKSAGEEVIGGMTLIAVFGLLYFSTHQWFWLFPLCFAGLPALFRGAHRIYSDRALQRQRMAEIPRRADAEGTRDILRIAQANKGKITPSIVTLNSSLSLDDAERLLQEMSSKGYASMVVTDSGRIEYEFPEFMENPDSANPNREL